MPLVIEPLALSLKEVSRVIEIDPLADLPSFIHVTVIVPLADVLAFLDSSIKKKWRPVSENCLLTLVVLFAWRL